MQIYVFFARFNQFWKFIISAGLISRSGGTPSGTFPSEALAVFTDRLNTLCSSLKADYPAAVIGWMAPWDIDFPGIKTVRDSIEAACLKYGIVYVDNSVSGINANDPAFRSEYFQSPQDNAHLNSKGHDLLSAWSERVLEQFGRI